MRLDAIVTRDDGALLLIDQSTVHSTSPSYRKETLRSLCSQLTQHLQASPELADAFLRANTPEVSKREKHKHLKYAPLVHLLRKQFERGQRERMPEFMAPIISHNGEFSSDVFKIVDWFAAAAARKAANSQDVAGCKPKDAARLFRMHMKDSFADASAKGVAGHLVAAMMPTIDAPKAGQDLCSQELRRDDMLRVARHMAMSARSSLLVQA